MILAMQTGGELASLAVLDGMDVAAEIAFRHHMQLSRDLLPEVDALLKRVPAGWEDVDAVAVALGPGSFTGARIGVVTAKSLAWASGRPVLGICSLAALAAPQHVPEETLLCAVLEARPGEFFTALYQRLDDELVTRSEPAVLAMSDLAARLGEYPGPVLVTGHRARFARSLGRGSSTADEDAGVRKALGLPSAVDFDEEPEARWVGRLAVARLRAGEVDHPARLAPLYVRAPMPTLKRPS
jgi:tRNA threonylcarbamoyladenosine biosynthesis protein TsaB